MQDTEEDLKWRISQLEQELQDLKSHPASRPMHDLAANPDQADKLVRFLEVNSFAVMRATVTGEILEANQAFIDLIGYSHEEIASKKVRWLDITPPEFLDRDYRAIEQLAATGVAIPFEKEYIAKDGRRVPILLSIISVDPEGNDCFCFVADVTEQKAREAELALSESQFRTLVEDMPQIIFVSNAEGDVIHLNHQWSLSTGIERTPGYEGRWIEAMLPEDVELILKEWAAARAEGKVFETESKYRNKDGQFRHCLVRALPWHDSHGEITRWFGTSTDIQEQKEAEQRLRDSEARLRTLADSIPQIVWTANPNGCIDFFNHRWLEYTGLSVDQSLNDGWRLLIHPKDLNAYIEAWENALETGNTYEAIFRLKRSLGVRSTHPNPYRRHLVRAVPLKASDGKVLKWFATWTEIEQSPN